MQDSSVGDNPRAVAAWLDMLGDKGLGNYRDLLEAVSRHPMMGMYLSHLRNQKADARTGRVPDENYAREVMQLFSIGLVELNADGSVRSQRQHAARDLRPGRHRRPGQGVHRLELGLPRLARQQLLLRRLGERQLRPGPQLQERCSATRSTTATEEKKFLGTHHRRADARPTRRPA